MTKDTKVLQGTAAWFEMVATLMDEAAARAGLPPEKTVSLVERYTDGVQLSEGLYQGIRIDITNGKLSFRVGVRPQERGDVTVELTAAAARRLNTVQGAEYQDARQAFLDSGEMRVDGDPSRMGAWMDAAHDPIVDRTL